MAKQTFTTGQVLTAAQMTSLQQTALGGGSTTAKTASYVLVAADAGTVVQMNAAGATTITVNTALFAAGDTVQIQNVGAGVCTVTAGTATVSTSATLALKQFDAGTLYFNTTSAAFFFAVDAADGMSNPLTTTGDIIYSSSGTTAARLGIGSSAQVLTVTSGIPAWETPAAPASGLTFIKSQTIGTTVSSVTVTSAFSATYDNYVIQVSGGLSSLDGITGQLTLGSTTSGYYMAGQYQAYSNTTVTGFNINNGSNFSGTYSTQKIHSGKIDLQNPFASDETIFSTVIVSAATGEYQARYAGFLNNTTSYTAFTITPNTGTFTGGTIRVYGYQNS